MYEGVSKSFRTESITKYTLTFGITQRVMAAKLTRLTHKIAIQLHLVADSCTICSSRSRRSVWKIWIHPRISDGGKPKRCLCSVCWESEFILGFLKVPYGIVHVDTTSLYLKVRGQLLTVPAYVVLSKGVLLDTSWNVFQDSSSKHLLLPLRLG
jgi:hypothetical protein